MKKAKREDERENEKKAGQAEGRGLREINLIEKEGNGNESEEPEEKEDEMNGSKALLTLLGGELGSFGSNNEKQKRAEN